MPIAPLDKTSNPPWITALILAGGQSTRMGEDKALVSWQGQPLIQRVSDVAHQCCDRVAILSPWPEKYQNLLPETVQLLAEHQPGQGPLIALQQGIQYLFTPWVLLLACDLPRLDPTVLKDWIAQLPVDPPPAQRAYVPHQQQSEQPGWEPLCGFYHQDCRPYLAGFIAQGGRAFQAWLPQLPACPLPMTPQVQAMLKNCNTPADLTSLS